MSEQRDRIVVTITCGGEVMRVFHSDTVQIDDDLDVITIRLGQLRETAPRKQT